MKTIFEYKDIEPQLTEEQKTDLKHEIKLATRDKKMQAVRIGTFGKTFCILTDGKMIFVPEDEVDEVWVFNKEGFLSIASNEFEKGKLEECLGVKPRKARLVYSETNVKKKMSELEKHSKTHIGRTTLGAFLDWTSNQGLEFAERKEGSMDAILFPIQLRQSELLDEYFKIDAMKLEEERRALLDSIQKKVKK